MFQIVSNAHLLVRIRFLKIFPNLIFSHLGIPAQYAITDIINTTLYVCPALLAVNNARIRAYAQHAILVIH